MARPISFDISSELDSGIIALESIASTIPPTVSKAANTTYLTFTFDSNVYELFLYVS